MDYNKLALLYGRFTIGNCHHRGISTDEQDAIHQKMPDKRDSFLSSGISDGSPRGSCSAMLRKHRSHEDTLSANPGFSPQRTIYTKDGIPIMELRLLW